MTDSYSSSGSLVAGNQALKTCSIELYVALSPDFPVLIFDNMREVNAKQDLLHFFRKGEEGLGTKLIELNVCIIKLQALLVPVA